MRFGRTFVTLAALALATPLAAQTAPAPAADPVALGYAQKIIDTALPPDRREDMVIGMMRTVMGQMRDSIMSRFTDEGLRQIIDVYLAKMPDRLRPVISGYMPRLTDAMTQAYVREFSRDELQKILEFSETPSGKHYLARSSSLMSDPAVAAANQTLFTETQRATQESEGELKKAITDYLTKHPEVARKMAQEANAKAPQP